MSSFILDNYKAKFSVLSVDFGAGNELVKKEGLKPLLHFPLIFNPFGICYNLYLLSEILTENERKKTCWTLFHLSFGMQVNSIKRIT